MRSSELNTNYHQFCSTFLDFKNDISKKKIISGPWCYDHEFFENNTNSDEKIINYQNDISEKDYRYLQDLLEIFSKKIGFSLNKLHNLNFSDRYWNILILPWLMTYLTSQFSRWKILQEALLINKNLKILKLKNLNFTPAKTTAEYLNLIKSSDEFNYFTFRNILTYLKDTGQINLEEIIINDRKKNYDNVLPERNNLFLNIIENINLFLVKKNNIYIEHNLFKKKNFFKINFFLKQIPIFLFNRDFDNKILKSIKYDFNVRNNLKLKKDPNFNDDHLKLFLNQRILLDLPICFVEGYKDLKKSLEKINFFPKLILSGFNHYHNERYKLWIAEIISQQKTKFLISSHGGGNQLKYSSCLQFEKKIADTKLVWTKPREKNDKQMPPIKFIGNHFKIKKRKYLIFIEEPSWKYPVRFEKGSSFKNYNLLKIIKKRLNKNVYDDFIYLPSTDSTDLEKKAVKNLINDKYYEKNRVFHKFQKFSKITLCAFPETAFLESMLNGPTILVNDFKKKPIINDDMFNYIQLEENKISFPTVEEAVEHINNIWNNVEQWWEQDSIKKLLEKFKHCLCKYDSNALKTWSNFLIEKKERENNS